MNGCSTLARSRPECCLSFPHKARVPTVQGIRSESFAPQTPQYNWCFLPLFLELLPQRETILIYSQSNSAMSHDFASTPRQKLAKQPSISLVKGEERHNHWDHNKKPAYQARNTPFMLRGSFGYISLHITAHTDPPPPSPHTFSKLFY